MSTPRNSNSINGIIVQFLGSLVLFIIIIAIFVGVSSLPTVVRQEKSITGDIISAEKDLGGIKDMSSWLVSGAGDLGYNGVYTEDGTYNGKPCYKLDDSHWLSWSSMAGAWVLGAATGLVTDDYYGAIGAELPASPWNVAVGTSPAPTISPYSTLPFTWLDNCYDMGGYYVCHAAGNHIICFYNPHASLPNTGYSVGSCTTDTYELVVHHAAINGFPVFHEISIYQYTKAEFLLEDQDAQELTGSLIHTCNTDGSGDTLLEADVDVRHIVDFTSLDDGVYYFIARGIHTDNTAEQCIAVLSVDRDSSPVDPDPDPPPDPTPGVSDLTITSPTVGDESLGQLYTNDSTIGCSIVVSAGGVDIPQRIEHYIYINGVLFNSSVHYDSAPGTYSRYFSGAALYAGDIVKYTVMVYDTSGDYATASISMGVAEPGETGYKLKTTIIGDSAGDFTEWTFSGAELSGHDIILELLSALKYKAIGTLELSHDSGYASTTWDLLAFSTNTPVGTAISFYIRVADTEDNLASATYYPTAGISASGYDLSADDDIISGQWAQIKAILSTTDVDVTPEIYSVELFYSVNSGESGSKKWDTTLELNEATLTDVVVADGVATLDGAVVNTYENSGSFLLRLDTGGFSAFNTISWIGTVPANTSVSVRTRSFSDTRDIDDAEWSTPITNSGTAITSADGIFLDIEVTLSTTDVNASPEIESITVEFQQEVEPGISYVYTTEFTLPTVLGTLILADIQYNQDPACHVQYRYSVSGETDWALMREIDVNNLMKVLTSDYLSGESLIVAARMVCASTSIPARIDEIGLLFSLEDGRTTQIL